MEPAVSPGMDDSWSVMTELVGSYGWLNGKFYGDNSDWPLDLGVSYFYEQNLSKSLVLSKSYSLTHIYIYPNHPKSMPYPWRGLRCIAMGHDFHPPCRPRPKSIINGSPLSRSTRMFWMGSTIITSCLWGAEDRRGWPSRSVIKTGRVCLQGTNKTPTSDLVKTVFIPTRYYVVTLSWNQTAGPDLKKSHVLQSTTCFNYSNPPAGTGRLIIDIIIRMTCLALCKTPATGHLPCAVGMDLTKTQEWVSRKMRLSYLLHAGKTTTIPGFQCSGSQISKSDPYANVHV